MHKAEKSDKERSYVLFDSKIILDEPEFRLDDDGGCESFPLIESKSFSLTTKPSISCTSVSQQPQMKRKRSVKVDASPKIISVYD